MSIREEDPHGLAKLIGSRKYSDLKLVCYGEEFHVHKAIVCTQSPVIAAACDGSFLEAATNIINIEEFDAETVERMVSFLYKKEYDDGAKEERRLKEPTQHETQNKESSISVSARGITSDTPAPETMIGVLSNNVCVNAIADYFDIPPLKELANRKIKHLLESSWSANDFCDIAKDAFNSTSDTKLQNLLSSTAVDHIEELLQLEKFVELKNMGNFFPNVLRSTVALHKRREESSAKELKDVNKYYKKYYKKYYERRFTIV